MLNHVFLMEVHNWPLQVVEIIHKLDAPNHFFIIHIDKKSRSIFENEKRFVGLIDYYKVVVVKDSVSVNWGGYSQIVAEIRLMQTARNHPVNFDYYHLISGQCWPFRSNNDFDLYFEKIEGKSLLDFIETPNSEISRYDRFHFNDIFNYKKHEFSARIINIIQYLLLLIIPLRKPLPVKSYFGANWFSIHRSLVDYTLSYIKENESFCKRFKHTSCCDEIFFQTIMCNSPLINDILPNNKRYVSWERTYENEPLPRELCENDFESICEMNPLFIRKINLQKKGLINKIETHNKILQLTIEE